MMKKSYLFIIFFLLFIILITILGSSFVSGNIPLNNKNDILTIQSNKEVYFNVYGYDINNPNVVLNPYGNSPLTAIIMFTSSDYSEVEIVIKGKNGGNDISYVFDKDKYHMIPVYGLYADYDNTVIIRCEGTEKIINIKTDKLPDDFVYVDNMLFDDFMFYNGNYPYVVDGESEVRWYLNSNYYGDITLLENSSFIIGSDRYNENDNVISFYKMNFLGKIYNEYMVNEYYGNSALYQDNILVLCDKILLIDVQTGEVIADYGNNNGYEYLDVLEDNIIVYKDNVFYEINNDHLEEIVYNKEISNVDFYNNTSNYKVLSPNRFGVLKETTVSDEKTLLISYEKLDKMKNVDFIKEKDRIKIVNNSSDNIYVILDRFMDKRIYEVDKVKYINTNGLKGKYTIYLKIDDKIYKTDYYFEV